MSTLPYIFLSQDVSAKLNFPEGALPYGISSAVENQVPSSKAPTICLVFIKLQ